MHKRREAEPIAFEAAFGVQESDMSHAGVTKKSDIAHMIGSSGPQVLKGARRFRRRELMIRGWALVGLDASGAGRFWA